MCVEFSMAQSSVPGFFHPQHCVWESSMLLFASATVWVHQFVGYFERLAFVSLSLRFGYHSLNYTRLKWQISEFCNGVYLNWYDYKPHVSPHLIIIYSFQPSALYTEQLLIGSLNPLELYNAYTMYTSFCLIFNTEWKYISSQMNFIGGSICNS